MTTYSGVPWSGSGHAAPTHAGDLLLPPGKAAERVPVVVLVHGGFWHTPYDRTLMDALAADCAARGWAAWNIDYCRIEDPEGGWPGTLQDAAAALDFLAVLAEEHPLDLGRVAVVGHSAGGHLALWLGARARLSDDLAVAASFKPPRSRTTQLRPLAVVSLAGVADLVEGSRLGEVVPSSCYAARRTRHPRGTPSPRPLPSCPRTCRRCSSTAAPTTGYPSVSRCATSSAPSKRAMRSSSGRTRRWGTSRSSTRPIRPGGQRRSG